MRPWIATGVLLYAVLALPASAILVRPDGTGDAPTIQAAIDDAVDFTVIDLADGVFRGPGNRFIDFDGKQITLRSLNGNADACIIDGEGSESDPVRVMAIRQGEGPSTRLENITITGGYIPDGKSFQNSLGAGLLVRESAPTIEGCVFRGNHGPWGAGLTVYIDSATIIDCVITDNDTGVYSHVYTASTTVSRFVRCRIFGNEEYGVFSQHSRDTLVDCEIYDNGEIGHLIQEDSIVRIEGARIHGNDGGGIVVGERASLVMLDSFIFGNRAERGAGVRGGIFPVDNATIEITDSVIAGNVSTGDGGAIYGEKVSFALSGVTIAGNSAARGGGIFLRDATGTIERSIVWGNCVSEDGETGVAAGATGMLALTCSLADMTEAIAENGGVVDATADVFAADPLFCGPAPCGESTLPEEELRLSEGSPALPGQNECGELLGALGEGCATVPVHESTWGGIKAKFGAH